MSSGIGFLCLLRRFLVKLGIDCIDRQPASLFNGASEVVPIGNDGDCCWYDCFSYLLGRFR